MRRSSTVPGIVILVEQGNDAVDTGTMTNLSSGSNGGRSLSRMVAFWPTRPVPSDGKIIAQDIFSDVGFESVDDKEVDTERVPI